MQKWQQEAANRRRSDNAMVKRKSKKTQTMIYKTPHIELKIEQHEAHENTW
jgi:hypothetical protein